MEENINKVDDKKVKQEGRRGEELLPIGTVVMLKGAKKRVMISGFCAMDEEHPGKVWNYSGCMYPEGFLSSNQTCLFDHEQIEKVYHLGLIDDEEEEFKEKLRKLLNGDLLKEKN